MTRSTEQQTANVENTGKHGNAVNRLEQNRAEVKQRQRFLGATDGDAGKAKRQTFKAVETKPTWKCWKLQLENDKLES